MKKYALIFLVAYLVFNGIFGVCMDWLSPKVVIALGFVAPVFGCIIAAAVFAKIDKREPEPNEVKTLSWLALLFTLAISLLPIIAAVFLSSPGTRDVYITLIQTKDVALILGGSIFLTSLVGFVSIRTTFAWWVRLARTRGVGQTAA